MSDSRASDHSARPLDPLAATVVVALCLSWGLNQVAIKLTLPDIPPLIQATVRSLGALAVVVAWCAARRVPLLKRDGTLVPGVIAGILFGVEFLLLYPGLNLSTASRASIFIYTAPFFVALGGAFFLPGERLGPWQWLGLALSFTGTAVAIGVPQAAVDARMLTGDVMLIGGGARVARLPDRVGGGRHLRHLVRAGEALFRKPALRLHLPDALVRHRGRPCHARRPDRLAFCARRRPRSRGSRPSEQAALTRYTTCTEGCLPALS